MRIISLIDGFNLFHALEDHEQYKLYKWLDLRKLTQCFLKNDDVLVDVYYFSAFAHWEPRKVKKHTDYINALETADIKTILGEFKKKSIRCRQCGKLFQTFVEKQTDMSIGMHLFGLAHTNKYDAALILSADADLLPAITTVKHHFPEKQIGMIFPIGRRKTHPLMIQADFYHRMRERHLIASQFDEIINLPGGKTIKNPFHSVTPS